MSEEFVPLMEAARYVGVSNVKLARLAREGVIAYVTSPLDRRVKLFRRADLDQLKSAPRPASKSAPSGRSDL